MSSNHYDVIIIGTGAGGGTLAYKLAPSGKRILLLERGSYVPREQDNWSTRAVNIDARYNTHEKWRDKEGRNFTPIPITGLAAIQSFTAPHCSDFVSKTSANSGITAASRRRGRSPMTN